MLEFKVSSLVHTFSKIISLPRSWISTQNYRNKTSSLQTSGCIYLYCPIADCDCIYVLYLIPSTSNFVHFYHSRNSFFQTTTKPLQNINSSRLSEILYSINSTLYISWAVNSDYNVDVKIFRNVKSSLVWWVDHLICDHHQRLFMRLECVTMVADSFCIIC